ncbi:MAG: hypothetical protein WC620_10470 [Methanoregula sp.]
MGGFSLLTCMARPATEQILLFSRSISQTTRATLRKSGLAQNLTGNGIRGTGIAECSVSLTGMQAMIGSLKQNQAA